MNKLMIDPSLVFISEEKWLEEKFRDEYLESMIKSFQEIDKQENVGLVWSYLLEEFLWLDRKYRPWSELSENNSLVPILYKFFRRNVDYLTHKGILASSIPIFSLNDEDIVSEYYQLANELVVDKVEFAYYSDENPIEFTSHCGIKYIPVSFINTYDIAVCNIYSKFSQTNLLEEKKKVFAEIIELYCNTKNLTITNEFEFSNSFIKKVEDLDRETLIELIRKLSLRISYNSQQARGCQLLQEEFITKHKINEYRIRITPRPTSRRVHFIFESGKILFKHFYDVGEHDEGL